MGLRGVILAQGFLQRGGDLVEEGHLLCQEVLHLRPEVPHAELVEVLDLGQRGA